MGRISRLNTTSAYTVTDLFRYAAAGVRQLTSGSPSYFSIDGGVTSLDGWNNFVTGNTGDLADWDTHAGFDAFNDGSNPGVINALTSADIVNMAALGWTVTGAVSSGVIVVSSGQTSTGVVLSSGNQLTVLSGGITSGTQISNVGTKSSPWAAWRMERSSGRGPEFVGGVASGDVSHGLEHVLAGGLRSERT